LKFFIKVLCKILCELCYRSATGCLNIILISLKTVSPKAGLSGKVAYGAENCSVNYRRNRSGSVKLKNSFDLPNLIAGHFGMYI
jgi:hypothetical protein